MSIKIDETWKLENGLYKCPECSVKKSKKGIATHIFRKHTIEGEIHSNKYKLGQIKTGPEKGCKGKVITEEIKRKISYLNLSR